MPLYKKCCICGRLCDVIPKSAEPYSKGVCCNECYIKNVIPTIKDLEEKKRRKRRWVKV